jgi:hypothetical protein
MFGYVAARYEVDVVGVETKWPNQNRLIAEHVADELNQIWTNT